MLSWYFFLKVWDFVLLKNDTRLISGSSDAELRVWSLRFKDPEEMAGMSYWFNSEELTFIALILDCYITTVLLENMPQIEFVRNYTSLLKWGIATICFNNETMK